LRHYLCNDKTIEFSENLPHAGDNVTETK